MIDEVDQLIAAVLRNYVSNKMDELEILGQLDDSCPYELALMDMNKEAERLVPTVMD